MGERRRTVTVTAAVASVLLALTVLAPGQPVSAADVPTWDEIEAARSSESATSATIATLQAVLDDLQNQAAALGDEAVARRTEADVAQAALVTATTRANALGRRADDAAARSTASATRAAQIAAALYRSGSRDLTSALLLDGSSGDLLDRLGALDQVGGTVVDVLAGARFDLNEATALADQAALAREERDRLAAEATSRSQVARAAADAADAALAQQQATLSQAYQQLAALKNTTAELERQYRIAQSDDNNSGSDDGGGFSVPGSDVNNPAAAQAFAFAQLAAWGFGSDQNSCLLWLWNRESGWRTNAYNASSGAYGIPQSLPGSKMGNYAADWRTNYETQVMWGLLYIDGRYGSPCSAWAHSQSTGWY